MSKNKPTVDNWDGLFVEPGQSRDIHLAISESYSGMNVKIPIHVIRAPCDGPVIFVTAALHGDEINGTGAVRQLILDSLRLVKGSLILVPVLNLPGFDRHSRYLPDRRDLNRSFPGSATGSLASRMARRIFDQIVCRSDFGIDLHTAAVRRTNYPNVRGDLTDPGVRRIAEAFGCEIILNTVGPKGCFRREACRTGCPTIVMEGGEVWKVEPGIVASCVRGIRNVLCELEMLDEEPESPDYQVTLTKTKWIRADRGGFLQFHVQPGEIIERDQPLATNTTILGREHHTFVAPFNAMVIGMTTLPAVSPGEPICNLGKLPAKFNPSELRRLRRTEDGLEGQVVHDLASNLLVVDPT